MYIQVEVFQNILKPRCWPLALFIFCFLKKKRSLKPVSLPHFLHNFWRRMFFTSYSINWQYSITWLRLLLEILGNKCIVMIWCPVCEVINFEINLSSLIKPFSYMTKKSEQKCKYPQNKKKFFIIFKRLSVVRNSLRPESGRLKKSAAFNCTFV